MPSSRFVESSVTLSITALDPKFLLTKTAFIVSANILRSRCVVQISWANPNFGQVLAAASDDGSVYVWEKQGSKWQNTVVLNSGSHSPVTDIEFSPREMGLMLSVASRDGTIRYILELCFVENMSLTSVRGEIPSLYTLVDIFSHHSSVVTCRMYEGNQEMDGRAWGLHSEASVGLAQTCTCLHWRQSSPGLPPMLAAGTSKGAKVLIFSAPLGAWSVAAELTGEVVAPAAKVQWCPTLGRPTELIAVASGSEVAIWSLKGSLDHLQVRSCVRPWALQAMSVAPSVVHYTAGSVCCTDGCKISQKLDM